MTSGKDAEKFLTFYQLSLIRTKYVLIKSIEDLYLRSVGSPTNGKVWKALMSQLMSLL